MFESLSERLQGIIRTTSGQSQLNEDNINDALREVRRAFLEADVSLKVVKAFISNIKERANGEEVLKSVTPGQQLVKIVNDELVQLLGKEISPLSLDGSPNIIMLFGLQGAGKTTSAAKLAIKLRKDGRNPLMIAADVYRPAAIKQLQSLGKQIGVPVFAIEDSKDVHTIVKQGIEHAKENNYNSVIVDTAGRLQIDTELMAELLLLERMFSPQEKLLVIDAMTGQEAVNVGQMFNEQLDISGIVMTKLDGDARGGAALSVVYSTNKPIKLVGMGEKIDALEPFYPDRMAQRILGMGDIVSLVEKAQQNIDIDEAQKLQKKMMSKDFSFDDFLKLQKQMKSLGSLGQILDMLPIPGISKNDKEMISHTGEKQLKRVEACISSMTFEERKKPDLLNHSRRNRIAAGSGIPLVELNRFIKDFENMRKMMKQMTGMMKNPHQMKNMMKKGNQFKGKFPKF